MKTQTNQWVIKVNKMDITEGDIYFNINRKAHDKAIKELSPNAFKLWSYISANQNGYTFALSQAHVLNTINISHATYVKVKSELCNKGYLICEDGDYYMFYEMPLKMTDEELKNHNINAYNKGETRKELNKIIKELKAQNRQKPLLSTETIYIDNPKRT